MALIEPGDYNLRFNEHFYILQLISSSFFWFLIIIIICVGAYIAYRNLKNKIRSYEIEDLKEQLDKNLTEYMDEFVIIARQFSDIEMVMGVNGNAHKHLCKDLIPLMRRLLPYENWIYRHCSPRDIQYWEKYKLELREQLFKVGKDKDEVE